MRYKMTRSRAALWIFFFFLLVVNPASASEIVYEGLIDAHVMIELGSSAEGVVTKVFVDRSSLVKKGQTLVNLDSSVEQAKLDKAATMANFDGEIQLQQAQLDFARRIHNRVKQINSISIHDRDQAATDVILTEFRLKKAKESQALARLELQKASAVLTQRTIKSPIDGIVVERYVSIGEYVDSRPLLRLAQINPLRVEVIVPSQMFGKITPGMKAKIDPELAEYGQQTATVTLVDRVIDPASSTFGVRLELPNDDNLIPSGQKCQVHFEIPGNNNPNQTL